MNTVNDLKPGEKGLIKEIKAPYVLKKRLMDLGILKGSFVEMIKSAPLGDPIEIKSNGIFFALRRSEAECLIIENGEKNDGEKRHRHRFGR